MLERTEIRLIATAAVFAAAVCFFSCSENKKQEASEVKTTSAIWEEKRLQLYNDSIYPAAISRIRSGDMITRLGLDITSEMLRQLNLQDQSFSHCGIASIENDTVFVYHAIGGELNPDEKLRRETLFSFGHPSENKAIGIFSPAISPVQNQQLISIVQKAFKDSLKFDMQFDYASNERQYCAEFVAKAFTKASADSSWLHFSHKGKYSYVAVDNLFLSPLLKEKARFVF